ncbi:integrin alpha-8-like [Diadema antillarum]|uniref:integrin alpha-8-like n=1 Tax=Diadema antillarum TaxID=105358 RepID=UPI003A848478
MASPLKALVLFYMSLAGVGGFNMDTQAPVVQSIAGNTSYFGYSIAMHRENGVNLMLVGAPKHQTADPNVDRGGALFQCPVTPYDNPSPCRELRQFNDQGNDVNEQNEAVATKSGQWFGASVKSSGEDGIVLACRPLYTWFIAPESSSSAKREPIGGCFVARNNFTQIETYEPCRTPVQSQQSVFGISHCEAGLSADITQDEILLGAPGSFFWQGQIWLANTDLQGESRHTNEGPLQFDDSYRGYAVSFGDFKGDSRPEYAIGIPRANDLAGMVSIYDASLTAYLNLTGTQVGAYFGQSIAVSDLNSDGLNDIATGAPFFIDEEKTTDGWEIGKVYIFYNDGAGGFSTESTILGTQVRARFGAALAALSDVNQDGHNDLAISSPYGGESGKGVVYIYHGIGSRGLSTSPAQTLEPASFGLDLQTFGFSMSAGMDMDNNQYPDLLIGAYKSNSVVLVRSRPVVHVTAALTAVTEAINLKDLGYTLEDGTQVSSFNLSVCLTYSGTSVPPTLDFSYTIQLDYTRPTLQRVLFQQVGGTDAASLSKTVSMQSNVRQCDMLVAYVKPSIVDKLSPVGVSLNFRLADETPSPGEILPILDESITTYASVSVPIQRNCLNQTCVPDLNVRATTDTTALVVGQSESVYFNVTISNTAEDAYLSKLTIAIPQELQYVGFTRIQADQIVTCTSNIQTSEIVCDVGNPFAAGRTIILRIQFSSDNLPGNRDNISIRFGVSSVEGEASTADNEFNVTVAVKVSAELSLFGVSNPEKLIYSESEFPLSRYVQYDTDIGPEITHVFSLYNNGPSRVGDTNVTLLWPVRYDSSRSEYLLYLISASVDTGEECTLDGKWNPENIKTSNETTPAVAPSGRKRRATSDATVPTATDAPPSTVPPDRIKKDIACSGDQRQYCQTITCRVDGLGAGNNAVRNNVIITVRSRVWTNTMTRRKLELSVFVTAEARVLNVPYETSYTVPINVTSNQVRTEIVPQFLVELEEKKDIPLWIYLVSALSGVLILILIIVVLHFAGFFKRKKLPAEQRELLKGNGEKKDADEN